MKNKILSVNKRGFVADFNWLPSLEKILKSKFKIKKSISIALVTKAEIKKFNKVYRGKDKITDVLSFNIDSNLILGEVVICLEQAKVQAKHSLKEELKMLTVHGILHLLGYNHEKNATEAKKQIKAEQDILNIL